MLFPDKGDVDDAWASVRQLVAQSQLGPGAKVVPSYRARAQYIICVYTADYDDSADVMRVLVSLRDSGLPCAARCMLNYKTDDATRAGRYADAAAARDAGFAAGAAPKRHKGEKVSLYTSPPLRAAPGACPVRLLRNNVGPDFATVEVHQRRPDDAAAGAAASSSAAAVGPLPPLPPPL
jgi:hypothetical protein